MKSLTLSTLTLLLAYSSWASAAPLYPRTGWQANLQTNAHNVSRRVTILDQDSLAVDNFTYDGGGLAVYFYLATDNTRTAISQGIAASGNILGQPHFGDSFRLDLPPGLTLDNYNAIAVWCVPAQANFGSGSFAAVPEPAGALGLVGAALLLMRRR